MLEDLLVCFQKNENEIVYLPGILRSHDGKKSRAFLDIRIKMCLLHRSTGKRQGIVYTLVSQNAPENGQLLKRLLELGLDPDQQQETGWTAAHVCSWTAKPTYARILVECRPDLRARNDLGDTPEEAASRSYNGVSLIIQLD
jgi:hypothetical protein